MVEGEDGTGAGADMGMETMREIIRVTIKEIIKETIKIMAVIQIGVVVVGEAEVGVIEVLGMKEEEVEGAEAMAVVVEGWVVDQGEVVVETRVKQGMSTLFALAKCLPWPVGKILS